MRLTPFERRPRVSPALLTTPSRRLPSASLFLLISVVCFVSYLPAGHSSILSFLSEPFLFAGWALADWPVRTTAVHNGRLRGAGRGGGGWRPPPWTGL